MSVQEQLAKVEEFAQEKAATFGTGNGVETSPNKQKLSDDEIWARKNLRWQGGSAILDLANALRVFDRHEDYKGRFKYNEMVNRAMDKGTVMIDWRIFELCAEIQERFLPGMDDALMVRALTVSANKNSVSK